MQKLCVPHNDALRDTALALALIIPLQALSLRLRPLAELISAKYKIGEGRVGEGGSNAQQKKGR